MQKSTILLLIAGICLQSHAQKPKEVVSGIKHVTVFTHGAQIEREADISCQPGQTTFRLTGLSPYIKKESIRIEGDGSFSILNVQHQNDYVNQLVKTEEIAVLNEKIEVLEEKIEDEEIRVEIVKEKLGFLESNKSVSGKDETMDPEAFKAFHAYYGTSYENLKLELLKRKRLIDDYEEEKNKLSAQMHSLSRQTDLPSGTILVTVESKQAKSSSLKFTYVVDNSSWEPSYDIRFMGVDEPLKITYKANIRQNTGVDWKDVHLTLSTSKTNVSAQIPELDPFYLQFYYPELSQALQGMVPGVQIQKNAGSPAPEPELLIRGTSSYRTSGNPVYVVDGIVRNDISSLDPNQIESIEVLKDASATAIYGSRAADGVILVSTKKGEAKSSIPLTVTAKRETSAEFTVDALQTIESNKKTTTVSFREADLDARFVYQSVPKLSEHVYLVAELTDWYKASLMDGEANVYLEDSYVGKSMLNTRQFSDTLEISFGIDNNIGIKREKLSEFSESQFIGPNRKETIAHKITIRNNKPYAVTTLVTDQIPVSTTKDIEVESLELADGRLNKDTGELEWDIALEPNETKELIIRYSVKYPKNKRVIIE